MSALPAPAVDELPSAALLGAHAVLRRHESTAGVVCFVLERRDETFSASVCGRTVPEVVGLLESGFGTLAGEGMGVERHIAEEAARTAVTGDTSRWPIFFVSSLHRRFVLTWTTDDELRAALRGRFSTSSEVN